jgi:hypothetical protein
MLQNENTATAPEPLFPNRMTLQDIARAMRPGAPRGACERTARNLMDRLHVPYVKLAGVRWYDRDAVRAALLGAEVNTAPRGRGRPRNAA